MYLLVLEEDSLDLEVLPFEDCFLASDLGVGLEELLLHTNSILGFNFFFYFPIDVWASNAQVFEVVIISNCVSLDCSLVNQPQKTL